MLDLWMIFQPPKTLNAERLWTSQLWKEDFLKMFLCLLHAEGKDLSSFPLVAATLRAEARCLLICFNLSLFVKTAELKLTHIKAN